MCRVICGMQRVTCHVSYVMPYLSCVMSCHVWTRRDAATCGPWSWIWATGGSSLPSPVLEYGFHSLFTPGACCSMLDHESVFLVERGLKMSVSLCAQCALWFTRISQDSPGIPPILPLPGRVCMKWGLSESHSPGEPSETGVFICISCQGQP